METIHLKRRDLLAGKCRAVLRTGQQYRLVVSRRLEVKFIEVGDTHLRFNSAVVLPVDYAPPAEGPTISGLDQIAAALAFVRDCPNPGKKILIAGHTDTSGGDASNVTLSTLRAQVVHGALVGDRDQFAHACWGPHLTDEQRYPDGGSGKKRGVLWDDYEDVLNWVEATLGWPCGYPKSKSTLWGATVAFQESYNGSDLHAPGATISESGRFDEATWKAVHDCYQVKIADLLHTDLAGLQQLRARLSFVDDRPDKHYVACGEFKPIDAPHRDEYRSQTNRRVELLYYDPGEEPAAPCLQGECAPDQCPVFDGEQYKRTKILLSPGEATRPLSLRLFDQSITPLENCHCVVTDSDAGRIVFDGYTPTGAVLTFDLPVATRNVVVRLELGDDQDSPAYEWSVTIAPFPGVTTTEGCLVRLRNLGYHQSDNMTALDDEARRSISRFQYDQVGLVVSGDLDADTCARIRELHDVTT